MSAATAASLSSLERWLLRHRSLLERQCGERLPELPRLSAAGRGDLVRFSVSHESLGAVSRSRSKCPVFAEWVAEAFAVTAPVVATICMAWVASWLLERRW
jgi:hypothetical protein